MLAGRLPVGTAFPAPRAALIVATRMPETIAVLSFADMISLSRAVQPQATVIFHPNCITRPVIVRARVSYGAAVERRAFAPSSAMRFNTPIQSLRQKLVPPQCIGLLQHLSRHHDCVSKSITALTQVRID